MSNVTAAMLNNVYYILGNHPEVGIRPMLVVVRDKRDGLCIVELLQRDMYSRLPRMEKVTAKDLFYSATDAARAGQRLGKQLVPVGNDGIFEVVRFDDPEVYERE